MGHAICSISDCGRDVYGRGWCNMHYQRARRLGAPDAEPKVPVTPEDSFAAHVAWDGTHLLWTGSLVKGYGKLRVNGRRIGAHRYAWEREHGSVPDGMMVDHECRNRDCVYPPHLRLATPAQNTSNRSGATSENARGVRNVYARGLRYQVKIDKGGVTYRFGTYATIGEAARVAEAKRTELFGVFAGAG